MRKHALGRYPVARVEGPDERRLDNPRNTARDGLRNRRKERHVHTTSCNVMRARCLEYETARSPAREKFLGDGQVR